ncbi:MAG: HupE/UreJ family protein [Paracoccus sp. (in: a-proteobacteria)]|uniref:HupE/UreJ family protein n=1 Tax=Paracoccus sp. TaxID=267 RepID=UPI0026E05364|nr:HupE/UreJ family protein [Paracoccus sp. (in: a-proteobacteria)]MDO5620249.1 HupE/UreJ family protein [Paracoccus sp. (in: a-proteobacteria)]
MKNLFILLTLLPSAALAHPGHDTGAPFMAGLNHPLGGTDHLLAMVAVGLWAALAGGRAIWAMPLTFVAAMLAGGALGAVGMTLPLVEPLILASSIIIGAAVALALRPSLAATLPLVALFGLAHGFAHGAEGPATGLVAYAAGFALATALLHLAGIGLGRFGLTATRLLGAATMAAGLALGFA